jgi:hypothetical protein
MTYDPSHRMPPSQERWPAATPAEGWPSYRDGEQDDYGYAAQAATTGNRYQTQGAVATAAYPAVANGYGGYAGAADDFDGRDDYGRDGYGRDGYGRDDYGRDGYGRDGYGRDGYGYQGSSVGYAEPQGGYAEPQGGYAEPQGGYAEPQGGYAEPQGGYADARDGYEWGAQDGYAGDAYLGPGSYVEPGAVLTDNRVLTDDRVLTDNRMLTHDAGLTAPDAGVYPDRWQAEQARRREARRRGPMVGAVSELLATGVVLGVSTLAAALLKSAASPVSAMAAVFAERTPAALRNAIVHHFGAHSGSVLLLGMYATFAVVAIVIGALARRDVAAGVAGVATFTLFAAFVAITRPASHVGDVMPVVIGGLAGVAAAMWLFRASTPQMAQGQMAREPLRPGAVRHGHGGTRRRTR